jgi:predicted transcriptional regulator
MVVWKRHDPDPSIEVKASLLDRLRVVADKHGPADYWIDETLRTIPGHFHAHARRRPAW